MKTAIKIIVPLLIIAGAFFLGKFLISKKSEPKSKKAQPVVPVVDVITVSLGDHHSVVNSFGTVQSYFETTLVPQVSGRITEVSKKFQVGEKVKKGELLATIDVTDFQAILANEQGNLALQQSELAEEEILAKQAAEDWVASGRKLDKASDFVLRKPQLAAAKASITSAEAAVKKAIIDIERTNLTAPYDAVVAERTASVGNLATTQVSLGRLIATEKVEVRLPLTAGQVTSISMPAKNQPSDTAITLSSPNDVGIKWDAVLTRVEPTRDTQNQVIYVIAEIQMPYEGDHPLAVGTFVNASIPTLPIKNTYKVPESALVNDSYVWVVTEENKLLRAPATREYSYDDNVYVKIETDEATELLRIVSRPLSNFRDGGAVKASAVDEKGTEASEG